MKKKIERRKAGRPVGTKTSTKMVKSFYVEQAYVTALVNIETDYGAGVSISANEALRFYIEKYYPDYL